MRRPDKRVRISASPSDDLTPDIIQRAAMNVYERPVFYLGDPAFNGPLKERTSLYVRCRLRGESGEDEASKLVEVNCKNLV